MTKDEIFEVLDEWAKITLLERRTQMVEYLNETFTQNQRNNHGDNIINMMCNDGDVAFLKMKLISKGAV